MQINAQRGIAPIAALIIGLLIIGGGAYGIKKVADKKKAVKATPAVAAVLPAPAAGGQAGMPAPETETEETAVTGETTPVPEKTVVTYGANGFSPKTVTIKRGETVIFQNKTGKPASIASNPHPTHTLYPEFDQYKTTERGKDEFRFVFEKVGAWEYHDHLNPNMTGTVIVRE